MKNVMSATEAHPGEATLSQNAPTDPPKDRVGTAMPQGIAALLQLVRILLGHGRRLVETVNVKGETPQFASIGVTFGTHNLPNVLARIQRGILRLLALETYLRKRAEKGREIPFLEPRARQVPAATPQPDKVPAEPKIPRKRSLPYNPESIRIPTMEELEAEVRRTSVGRTIARICLDLGVVPAFCTGEMGNALLQVLEFYGGSLTKLFAIRRKREIAFQKERDMRPDTWTWNWRDMRKERMRQVLGYLIGEEPPDDPIAVPA